MKYIVSLLFISTLVVVIILMLSKTNNRTYGQSYINKFDSEGNGFAAFQFSKKGKPYGFAIITEKNDIHIASGVSAKDIDNYTICIDTKKGFVFINKKKVDVLNAIGLIRVDKNGNLLKWFDGD